MPRQHLSKCDKLLNLILKTFTMALKKTKRKKVDKVLRKLKKKVSDYSSQLGFLPNRQPSQLSQLDINSLSHTSYADLNISRYYTTSWYNRVDDFQGLY